jgi:integrase
MTQIRAEDVDFSKEYLHIPASNAKFKKPRTVVLLPQVIEAIAKLLAGRTKGWLFPSYREGHISSRQVQNILDGIATRAGLQEVKRQDKAGKNRHRVHPHLLRHSFTVWSLDSGVPVGDLQDQLGHSSLATTGIYLKVSPNHRREAYMRSKLPEFLTGDKH